MSRGRGANGEIVKRSDKLAKDKVHQGKKGARRDHTKHRDGIENPPKPI